MLSELDIVVPLQLLIGMFSDGVNSLKELANQRKAHASDLSDNTGARRVSAMLRHTKDTVLDIGVIKPHAQTNGCTFSMKRSTIRLVLPLFPFFVMHWHAVCVTMVTTSV